MLLMKDGFARAPPAITRRYSGCASVQPTARPRRFASVVTAADGWAQCAARMAVQNTTAQLATRSHSGAPARLSAASRPGQSPAFALRPRGRLTRHSPYFGPAAGWCVCFRRCACWSIHCACGTACAAAASVHSRLWRRSLVGICVSYSFSTVWLKTPVGREICGAHCRGIEESSAPQIERPK